MHKIKTMIIAILVTLYSFGIAHSREASHMTLGGYTSQPVGHYEYCKNFPGDCSIHAKANSFPKLSRARWKELVTINARVNNTIIPAPDAERYGVEEVWSYPTKYGDCEDYALIKRRQLIQKGWPASALLVTVVKQPNGEGHAVLTVTTDHGDFILDNVDGKILLWSKTRYTFLKRQAWNNSGRWQAIVNPGFQISSR